MKDVLTGKLVRLSAFDPEEMSKSWPRWILNSEYFRLLFSSARPLYSPKAELKWMEEEVGEMSPANYSFGIRTLAEDKLIGELGLEVVDWSGREAFVGLGIGESEYWSKGYGTDLLQTFVRYLFTALPLDRVYLKTLDWNHRAQRCFEKAGFKRYGMSRRGEFNFVLMEIFKKDLDATQ